MNILDLCSEWIKERELGCYSGAIKKEVRITEKYSLHATKSTGYLEVQQLGPTATGTRTKNRNRNFVKI